MISRPQSACRDFPLRIRGIRPHLKLARTAKAGHYSDDQKSYLRSVVLHFLGEVCDETSTMTEAVLSIDADEPKAFEKSETEDLQLCLLEFAQRITFEMVLRCLLEGGAE